MRSYKNKKLKKKKSRNFNQKGGELSNFFNNFKSNFTSGLTGFKGFFSEKSDTLKRGLSDMTSSAKQRASENYNATFCSHKGGKCKTRKRKYKN